MTPADPTAGDERDLELETAEDRQAERERRTPLEAGVDALRISLRVLERRVREGAAGEDVAGQIGALRELAEGVATELGRPSVDEIVARGGRS